MWEMMFQKYCEYVAQQGIAAACYVQAKGSKLANWVNTQRQFQREGQLDIRRRQKLDGVGFIWHAQDGAWEQGYESLKDFKAREGHCRVPQTHVEGIFQLGRWVARQRRARLTILDERKRRLDAIGFVWNPLEDTWEKGFAALTTFKAHEGHCRVPQNYIEGTFKLGSWVQGQRANRDTMLPERMQRLDAIGFVWRAK
jgi:Helicase associated domain